MKLFRSSPKMIYYKLIYSQYMKHGILTMKLLPIENLKQYTNLQLTIPVKFGILNINII